jgi:hypothetical protein
MGAIVYQKDSGLGHGIDILGEALGQGIHQRMLQNRFKDINKDLEGQPITPSLLQEIVSKPGGMEYLQTMAPFIAPVLKKQAESAGASDWMKNMMEMFDQGQGDQGDQADTMLQGIVGTPPVSPIEEARMIQNKKAEVPRITPQEELSDTQNIQSDSGVPNTPSAQMSNARGPVEQTKFQQGGLQGTALNPPSETNKPAQQAQEAALPISKGPTGLSTKQMLMMTASPYKEHREFAKAALQMQTAKEKRDFEVNKPFLLSMGALRASLPEKEQALQRIDSALESGEINQFTDWAANRLGLDPLKKTQSQILEAAVKTFFLGDLSTVKGGRINQLLEKNLLFALQNPGKSPAANQEITEALHATVDMQKEKLKEFDHLSNRYESMGREVPRNFDALVDKNLGPYYEKRMGEFESVAKEIRNGKITNNSAATMRRAVNEAKKNPAPEGTAWMVSPDGKIKAVPIERIGTVRDELGGRLVEVPNERR